LKHSTKRINEKKTTTKNGHFGEDGSGIKRGLAKARDLLGTPEFRLARAAGGKDQDERNNGERIK
jgi:hypothetical protein